MSTARDNPFRTECLERLPLRLPDTDAAGLVSAYRNLGQHAAIVGPMGTGKTAILDAMQAVLEAAGEAVLRLRLDEEAPCLSTSALAAIRRRRAAAGHVFLDGAEQLGLRQWGRFLRLAAAFEGILITSHRAGRLPTLYAPRPDAALLRELVECLLGGPCPRSDADLAAHLRRRRGNVRAVLLEFYDREAQRSRARLGPGSESRVCRAILRLAVTLWASRSSR